MSKRPQAGVCSLFSFQKGSSRCSFCFEEGRPTVDKASGPQLTARLLACE